MNTESSTKIHRSIRVMAVLAATCLFAVSAVAETFTVSGSADGTAPIIVDDGLRVTVNGVEIHNSVGESSGPRGPFQFNGDNGDVLTFAVHDTFGDCRSLSPIFLTDSLGRSVMIFDGWNGGCGNPIDPNEVFSATTTIAYWPPNRPYSDIPLPGNAFAGLTEVPDGRLFGVTYSGGRFNKGTLYSINKSGPCGTEPGEPTKLRCYTVHHEFTGGGDGEVPYHELVYDPASGKLYGTSSSGPVGGTIFSFDPSTDQFATLPIDFGGRSAPQRQLVVRNNYIYGVLQYGDPFVPNNPAIFRVGTNGSGYTIIHEFADYGAMPQNIVLGGDGKLYGVSIGGGPAECYPNPGSTAYCGQVFSLDPVEPGNSNENFLVLKQFYRAFPGQCTDVVACANSPQALIYGSDGILYGATFYSMFSLDPHAANPASTLQILFTGGYGVGVSVMEGADDRLYAAYYAGGDTFGAGQIFSINKDGTQRRVVKEFTNIPDSAFGPWGKLFRDSNGNIFGTTEYTYLSSSVKGTVFFISSSSLSSYSRSTPQGSNISVYFPDAQVPIVSLTFDSVTTAGVTTVTEIDPTAVNEPLPPGYLAVSGASAYEIETSAVFTGNITVCINFPAVNDADVFSAIALLHGENGTLVDVTTSRDFSARTICGVVTSLSPFVLGQAAPTPTPTPEPTPSPTPEPTPTPTPEPTPTPTPEPTPTPTPEPTPTPSVPDPPSGLVADARSSSSIMLIWVDNSLNEESFDIERCDGKGKCRVFNVIATQGANTISFLDTGLESASQYSYRVRAVNAVGNSAYSNVAKARTPKR